MSRHCIVVGTDGSDASARALDWAIAEAKVVGADLEVVHVWSTPAIAPEAIPVPVDRAEIEAHGKSVLEAALHDALDRAGAAPSRVDSVLVEGDAAHELCERGREARQLIVGRQGHGFIGRAFLGSVADQCVHLGAGPVTVVPSEAPAYGARVVVGVDGSADAQAALAFAMTSASERHLPLTIMFVYPAGSSLPGVAVPAEMGDFGRTLIDDMIDRARADQAPLPPAVEPLAVAGNAAAALLEAANGAHELVVGAGRADVVHRLLGSVSRRCVHHAPCAVTVVHAELLR
ncbi:MAG TPA: universal stress protein [Acidimicrobiales bacterium]|nr:universal stress protein [Acidimicrobiales bacterium]